MNFERYRRYAKDDIELRSIVEVVARVENEIPVL
jgi:hypothetical protein